jgi:hypothetical protein
MSTRRIPDGGVNIICIINLFLNNFVKGVISFGEELQVFWVYCNKRIRNTTVKCDKIYGQV